MKYIEFLGAAKRHALCCHEIVNRYEELGKGHEKEKKALLNNAYYLSGYIIETLLSYAFFNCIRCKGEIEDNKHFKSASFKTHDLSLKATYAKTHNCDFSSLPLIGHKHKDKKIQLLFTKWRIELRYQEPKAVLGNGITIDDFKEYLNVIDDIEKSIIQKFPI